MLNSINRKVLQWCRKTRFQKLSSRSFVFRKVMRFNSTRRIATGTWPRPCSPLAPRRPPRLPNATLQNEFRKNQQNRYPKIDPRVHPNFDIPVGIFCETYEKARIAKAGNFEVPVGTTSGHENIATEHESESRMINGRRNPTNLKVSQREKLSKVLKKS